ncbi:MAG: bifunctional 5,10-methylenetetrahydrofolate dehydrogenase/5,10-methenyltetrahydrofolate cyclohydrolase [Alphaproteobacteria bacterium]|uniref:Bifunctional protein FolD n=1 Tax=PS1 clade bacterium TaxID=2175152 RepID=A0A368DTW7_9PROT|nr:bifunctional methylenetetrahydrofolate dehydrogenase/methenyltetrahydrofolate cyclohydrolase [Rhodobiaceae bacterium]OUT75139.1 MAG: bifunctional methylenetetrahydrofolate dehydrogenase/methenyltetrahydrofolate cyclohydrolase [Rhizobiales bacterium TMED25]RCL74723.1 MAG: bifunctional methylenetetrahydrofolate dehydrogenase/methenyltetrahydrofolate cyclohydrolase [PS1 clade bacterium]
MNAEKIIDGKIISSKVLKEVSESIIQIKSNGLEPCLAVVLVGNDPASSVYVRNKKLMCEKVGIKSIDFNLDERISEEELLDIIINLNKDKTTNGILVQFPLPSHIDKQKIINTISPDKDVDGLHPINAGRLMNNVETLVPCTPQGCMIMLRTCLDDLSGKNAVVIGRSNLVGRPMCQLLTNSDCTVTQVHSKTINIEDFISQADILIAAIGIPKFVRAEWLKDRSVIIDVGINRISDKSEGNNKKKLVGDVDFDEAIKKVAAITPVPGGVGLMTVACLMRNTLIATTLQM